MTGDRRRIEGDMLSAWTRKWGMILGGFFLSIMIPYMATLLWNGQVAVRNQGLSYSGDMVSVEGVSVDISV